MSDQPETSEGNGNDQAAREAAIQAAVAKAVAEKTRALEKKFAESSEEQTKGLKRTLEEVKEARDKLRRELDGIKAKAEADEAGVNPEKLDELVKARTATALEVERSRLASEIEETKKHAEKAEAEREEMVKKLHRARVEALMASEQGIYPKAFGMLADRLTAMVAFDEQDKPYIRDAKGEVFAGNVADAFRLARDGKGPLADMDFCLVSNGQGSGVTSTKGSGGSTKNVHKMTREERVAFQQEHGVAELNRRIDTDPQPTA